MWACAKGPLQPVRGRRVDACCCCCLPWCVVLYIQILLKLTFELLIATPTFRQAGSDCLRSLCQTGADFCFFMILLRFGLHKIHFFVTLCEKGSFFKPLHTLHKKTAFRCIITHQIRLIKKKTLSKPQPINQQIKDPRKHRCQ